MYTKKVFRSILVFIFILSINMNNFVNSKENKSNVSNHMILSTADGRITESFKGNSKRTIVLVQDLHCQKSVQNNITNILEMLYDTYGEKLKSIFVEGSWGRIDTSIISGMPRKFGVKEQLVRDFMNIGAMSGAEKYSIKYPGRLNLIGIENSNLYKQEAHLLINAFNKRGSALRGLEILKNKLDEIKETKYPKSLIDFENIVTKYHNGEIGINMYFMHLLNYSKSLNIDVYSDYPNISKIIALNKYRMILKNPTRILREISIVENKIYNYLSERERDILLDLKIEGNDRYYIYIKRLIEAHDIDISEISPVLHKYFEYTDVSMSIDTPRLVDEERDLKNRIKYLYSNSENTKNIIDIDNTIEILKNFLLNRATYKESLVFRDKDTKIFNDLTKFFDSFVKDKEWISNSIEYINNIKILFNIMKNFYKIARDRDYYMIKNTLSAKKHMLGDVSVMICGGYHVPGITERLRAMGVSYIVIAPNVSEEIDDRIYVRRVNAQGSLVGINLRGFGSGMMMITSLMQGEVTRAMILSAMQDIDPQEARRIEALGLDDNKLVWIEIIKSRIKSLDFSEDQVYSFFERMNLGIKKVTGVSNFCAADRTNSKIVFDVGRDDKEEIDVSEFMRPMAEAAVVVDDDEPQVSPEELVRRTLSLTPGSEPSAPEMTVVSDADALNLRKFKNLKNYHRLNGGLRSRLDMRNKVEQDQSLPFVDQSNSDEIFVDYPPGIWDLEQQRVDDETLRSSFKDICLKKFENAESRRVDQLEALRRDPAYPDEYRVKYENGVTIIYNREGVGDYFRVFAAIIHIDDSVFGPLGGQDVLVFNRDIVRDDEDSPVDIDRVVVMHTEGRFKDRVAVYEKQEEQVRPGGPGVMAALGNAAGRVIQTSSGGGKGVRIMARAGKSLLRTMGIRGRVKTASQFDEAIDDVSLEDSVDETGVLDALKTNYVQGVAEYTDTQVLSVRTREIPIDTPNDPGPMFSLRPDSTADLTLTRGGTKVFSDWQTLSQDTDVLGRASFSTFSSGLGQHEGLETDEAIARESALVRTGEMTLPELAEFVGHNHNGSLERFMPFEESMKMYKLMCELKFTPNMDRFEARANLARLARFFYGDRLGTREAMTRVARAFGIYDRFYEPRRVEVVKITDLTREGIQRKIDSLPRNVNIAFTGDPATENLRDATSLIRELRRTDPRFIGWAIGPQLAHLLRFGPAALGFDEENEDLIIGLEDVKLMQHLEFAGVLMHVEGVLISGSGVLTLENARSNLVGIFGITEEDVLLGRVSAERVVEILNLAFRMTSISKKLRDFLLSEAPEQEKIRMLDEKIPGWKRFIKRLGEDTGTAVHRLSQVGDSLVFGTNDNPGIVKATLPEHVQSARGLPGFRQIAYGLGVKFREDLAETNFRDVSTRSVGITQDVRSVPDDMGLSIDYELSDERTDGVTSISVGEEGPIVLDKIELKRQSALERGVFNAKKAAKGFRRLLFGNKTQREIVEDLSVEEIEMLQGLESAA